ncbi:hypothetical protein OG417_34265 [Actinoallomurus sp. NBC_01490]|nr:hypothetical protein [Actinoallomurus sp. NBC_01490]
MPVRAHQMRKERSVVARPRPDLQDAVARLHVELLKHLRDDSRRGSHAARSAVCPRVGDDAVVSIGLLDRGVGDEQMSWDSTHRSLDPRCMERPPRKSLVSLV